MSNIRFASPEHRDFFLDMMGEARRNDCYHRAFFYVMGIAPETRANIRRMFDFKQDRIDPEGMHGGGQTSGTVWCAALLSTSGTVIPTRITATPTPRRICFAASLRLTLWRA